MKSLELKFEKSHNLKDDKWKEKRDLDNGIIQLYLVNINLWEVINEIDSEKL